ncbi:MAG: aldehyde dehydrogenase family protein, partial [Clostridium perfringens]|nr:aldehyde dehydrogenase family protein [Clostridium perfringens]
DINEAFYIANKLEVGTVHVNNKTERGPDHFPFLGVKSSGMGTQGIRYSIEAMSRPKATVITIR